MIKILIPQDKAQGKTVVRGLWISDKGKLYYDYVKIITTYLINDDVLDDLKRRYNQEAIFYIDDNIAGIYYNENKKEILPKKIKRIVIRQGLKKNIKELLKLHKGVTIYKDKTNYILEVYYK